jgi:hypothetical protein
MFSSHNDANPDWIDELLSQEAMDVLGQLFLDVKSLAEEVHCTSELRQSSDLATRNVCDVSLPEERDHMMSTQGVERNVLNDDHFIHVVIIKHRECERFRSCQLMQHVREPFGGVLHVRLVEHLSDCVLQEPSCFTVVGWHHVYSASGSQVCLCVWTLSRQFNRFSTTNSTI